MSQPQAYIFPESGLTVIEDEYLDSHSKLWVKPAPGFPIADITHLVRRRVPSTPLAWIAYADRRPTAEDADQDGCVMVTSGKVTRMPQWKENCGHTHWHPLLKASSIPKRDTEREEFEAWWKEDGPSELCSNLKETFFDTWKAARARKEAP